MAMYKENNSLETSANEILSLGLSGQMLFISEELGRTPRETVILEAVLPKAVEGI